jgi:WD40 repeat protein
VKQAPFYAKDLSVEAQTFLYTCAFWAVAADEQLKSGEQNWLVEQFGADGMTKSLDEFVALDSKEFFDVFDRTAAALSAEDRRLIFPVLEEWLLSCIASDGEEAEVELETLERVKARLSLDREIERLRAESPATALEFGHELPDSPSGPMETGSTLDQGAVLRLQGHDAEITTVAVSPDGRRFLSGAEDGTVKGWSFDGKSEVLSLKDHESGITALAFCPDGRKAVSTDRAGALRLWDTESGDIVWEQRLKRQGCMTELDVSPDGKMLALSSNIGLITLRNIDDGLVVRQFGKKRRGSLNTVSFSPDGKCVATGGDDHTARLWDAGRGTEITVFEGHDDGVTSVVFNSNGKNMLSGARDNTIRVWQVSDGREQAVLKGHTFTVYAVCYSPDDRFILSSSWDHSLRVWDAHSGQQVFCCESIEGRFTRAVFHPDGRHVIAGNSDKTVHIVELNISGS